ncbi:ribosome small subunit-dependent GTPase A [Natronosporangium hydrolyticum]|uniref:Ribosome small subunit-dependent GTPase A n=1 Tax=Natronosporangium hydrolyticum TaxID=2811111 RepID=A0A895YMC1_9ACTN|nr:ribosome small subunit-dependent GTPase A [Natronosporangium hydrolyticum]QSB17115.1 ribosome small subunit-dependent GTPase A [Natronosporangium hydrolyticum]
MVVAVHLGRYQCVVDETAVTAMRARELGRRSVVVGDRVALVGDVSGDPDQLARIVRVAPRRSTLRRTADDDQRTPEGRLERVVVANADQLVIVSALADPPPRTGFIDRCLVAAYDAEIDPLLCLTKADLTAGADDPAVAELLDYYNALSLPYLLSRPDSPLEPLLRRLRGRMSVLVGHSGVGKSTLVNRLVPAADRAVGAVSAVGKGRHVSSSAIALRLPASPGSGPESGWIIDTPGVRSFGLAHVSADSLLASFTDLAEGSAECAPGCDHLGGPGCGLDAWVAAGRADPRRLASYRRLLGSRGAGDA